MFFVINHAAPTALYTLSLHDALPISEQHRAIVAPARVFDSQDALLDAFKAGGLEGDFVAVVRGQGPRANGMPELHKRSEEHTSELQSQSNLVCRLLLEKKNRLYNRHR